MEIGQKPFRASSNRGGGDGIRTRGPYVANVVLCQAELHPRNNGMVAAPLSHSVGSSPTFLWSANPGYADGA